jgi:hypothetical protein
VEVRDSDVGLKNYYSNTVRNFDHYLPRIPVLGLEIKTSKTVSAATFLITLLADDNVIT